MIMKAEYLMMAGAVTAFLVILHWVRQRELREKYAIGWIALSVIILIIGLFPSLLMQFAKWAHMTNATATLYLSLGVIGLFAFSVSVSLSRSYRRNMRLTQELALLEKRVRELETAAGSETDDKASGNTE